MKNTELTELDAFLDNQRTLLQQQRYYDFLNDMRKFVGRYPKVSSFEGRVDAVERQYFFMVRLLVGSDTFGSTGQISDDMRRTMSGLLRYMEQEFRIACDPSYFYGRARYIRMRPEENMQSIFADYIQEQNELSMDPAALTDTRRRSKLEVMAADIFDHIWTVADLTGETSDFIKGMIADGSLPAYDREMWVHAIGFGDVFDTRRDALLDELAHDGDSRISVAARVWTVVRGLFQYSNPYENFPGGLPEPVKTLADENPEEFADIVLFFIQAYMKPDRTGSLMADLMNMSRQAGMNIFTSADGDSPEKLMDNLPPEYTAKMRDMSEAQLRGDDVYVESLGRMRQFPFFSKVANWFLPFHMEHSELASLVDSDGAGVASLVEKLPALCDSDKYALMLSMAATPQQVRGAALANMYSSYSKLADSPEGESMLADIEGAKFRKVHISNIAKNIGRVFRFCKDAEGVFPGNELHVSAYLSELSAADDGRVCERVADSFFRLGYYNIAANLYRDCIPADHTPENAPEIARLACKCAAAYEAFNVWPMALSHRMMAYDSGDESYENAVPLVKDAMKMKSVQIPNPSRFLFPFREEKSSDPEYLRLLAKAYFAEENWNGALEVLYNLEYVLPEDDSSIKWLMLRALLYNGFADDARETYSKIQHPESSDKDREIVEYAAMLWYTGARKEALELLASRIGDSRDRYAQIATLLGRLRKSELETIYCGENGGAPTYLLLDALKYRFYGSKYGNM